MTRGLSIGEIVAAPEGGRVGDLFDGDADVLAGSGGFPARFAAVAVFVGGAFLGAGFEHVVPGGSAVVGDSIVMIVCRLWLQGRRKRKAGRMN